MKTICTGGRNISHLFIPHQVIEHRGRRYFFGIAAGGRIVSFAGQTIHALDFLPLPGPKKVQPAPIGMIMIPYSYKSKALRKQINVYL